MPYLADGLKFEYTPRYLLAIAGTYESYVSAHANTNGLDVKCDFDCALNALGRGRWWGDWVDAGIEQKHGYDSLKRFGNLQKLVIADVIGMGDNELWRRYKLSDTEYWRTIAYKKMANYLNNGL